LEAVYGFLLQDGYKSAAKSLLKEAKIDLSANSQSKSTVLQEAFLHYKQNK
jgi:hypothetical protein